MTFSQEENPFPSLSPPGISNYQTLSQNVELKDAKPENIRKYFNSYIVLMIILALGETLFCLFIFWQNLIGVLAFVYVMLLVDFLFVISITAIAMKSERILLMVCLIA